MTFSKPTRGRRAQLISRMCDYGRPCNDARYADIIIAAERAGLDAKQAWALGCAAFDVSRGNLENLTRTTSWLRKATLERKANDPSNPQSLWAWLLDKHGFGYIYLTDEQIFREHNDNFMEWRAWSETRTSAEAQS